METKWDLLPPGVVVLIRVKMFQSGLGKTPVKEAVGLDRGGDLGTAWGVYRMVSKKVVFVRDRIRRILCRQIGPRCSWPAKNRSFCCYCCRWDCHVQPGCLARNPRRRCTNPVCTRISSFVFGAFRFDGGGSTRTAVMWNTELHLDCTSV